MATIRSRTYKVLKRWSTAATVRPTSQTVCELWAAGARGDSIPCNSAVRSVLVRMLVREFAEAQISLQPRQLTGKNATIEALVQTIASSPTRVVGG